MSGKRVNWMERIAVIGGGLLGGSLALRLAGEKDVRLWARREASVALAQELGVEQASTDLAATLAGVELVVLSVPVGVMPGLVDRMLEAGLPEDCLVTDVGSVKAVVHREVAPRLRERGRVFVGSHPMAGGEKQGMEAARRDLFEGAMCFLTGREGAQTGEGECLETFWRELGCRTEWIDPLAHDRVVARISHLPHVMAAVTARAALANPEDARYGGGGLRDTTRVAGGHPGMWAEILLENREAVGRSLVEARDFLGEILASLESGDHEAVLRWLTEASELHASGRAVIQNECG
ncbi:prephenate dehydrogenase [Haloferula luteola]|uniref:Prephenate dehydrogenase n=1 Tax=Haloferula luteola TaxID=595692 RepID=A0A840VIA2_9BACT|nr:prephenate dehydrogenase/arogenate dehydrogenase family protein [Haloferula luteola]MBB5352441.1 prephenate dehydrogenase [Haloferula luteola]